MSSTCEGMAAISCHASDVRMGLNMTCGSPEDFAALAQEVAEMQRKHRESCPTCNGSAPAKATDAAPACKWVHARMAEHREVQTGILMSTCDGKLARQETDKTLREIRAHIDDCLPCRAAFREYLSDFTP